MNGPVRLEGIPLSKGVFLGRIHILTATERNLPQYFVKPKHAKREVKRFRGALLAAKKRLQVARKKLKGEKNPSAVAFLDMYEALLSDESITKSTEELIRSGRMNAEWALQTRADELSAKFDALDSEYMKDRKHDIEHLAGQIIQLMQPGEDPGEVRTPAGHKRILVARSISPTDILECAQRGYEGFATETGGLNSHAAIIARSLHIPFVGKVAGLMEAARAETDAILDAGEGLLLLCPGEEDIRRYKAKRKALREGSPQLAQGQKRRRQPTRTKDGEPVSLQANTELPDELAEAHGAGADEIGLFRTESLVLTLSKMPGEDEQYELYRRVLLEADGIPVTFRTLDIGGDKLPAGGMEGEEIAGSPLGLRAIRYSLSNPEEFLTQLRALLRASTAGPMRVMFPMLAHPTELAQTLSLFSLAREQLSNRSLHYAPKVPLGAMIEVPAAVFVMGHFARHLDFFSIGTNDLIQYMLAVDREDEKVATANDPHHPAVAHMLDMISRQARKHSRPLTLCGEMAGDSRMASLLLCLGIKRLSMQADRIPEVRAAIARADTESLRPLRRRALAAQTSEDILRALEVHAARQ